MVVHSRERDAKIKGAIDVITKEKVSLRVAAEQFGISKSTLGRHVHKRSQSDSRRAGRPCSLQPEEEQVIVEAAQEFSRRGTPLSRSCLRDLVMVLVKSFSPSRRSETQFRNDKPSPKFISNFLNRHPELCVRRRANLEESRANAMSPENIAEHMVRIGKIYMHFNIKHSSQVFNLDESGVSVRSANRGRSKAIFSSGRRTNCVDLKWSGNAEHVTIMPVVAADGEIYSPVVVLPGKNRKFRTTASGVLETPEDYLPRGAYVAYRDPAGVDSNIFYEWTNRFIAETSNLRKRFRYIVLIMDGYSAHVSYKALQNLHQHSIIAVGLPAHSSHRTQVLDVSVFSSFKSSIRKML